MDIISYNEVKASFKEYKNKFCPQFSPLQKDLSDELYNKLVDLEDISEEIVFLINELFPKNQIVPGENGTDIINFGSFSLPIKRANPNIPIKIGNYTVAYTRNKGNVFATKESRKKERRLERLSFEFYKTADRVSHITEKLSGLETFECKNIRIIRNKLLEHPEGKDSEITFDSFSYSNYEGPCIKGLRIGNKVEFRDSGFRSNSLEFISSLTKSINGALE